jgi:hypothetical protein
MTWNAEDEAAAARTWRLPQHRTPEPEPVTKAAAPHGGQWLSPEEVQLLQAEKTDITKSMGPGCLCYLPNTGKKTAIGRADNGDYYLVTDVPTDES